MKDGDGRWKGMLSDPFMGALFGSAIGAGIATLAVGYLLYETLLRRMWGY